MAAAEAAAEPERALLVTREIGILEIGFQQSRGLLIPLPCPARAGSNDALARQLARTRDIDLTNQGFARASGRRPATS